MSDKSFEGFQNIVDKLPGYIAHVNAQTLRYEFVNKGYEIFFGIPRAKIIGAHIKDIIGETNYQFAQKFIAEVRAGKSVSYENTFNSVSGTQWLQVNYSPLFDEKGNVTTIALLNYDITERKLSEKALRNSETELRHLFDHSPSAIAVVHKGIYIRVNDRYCSMFGYDKNEILGKSVFDVLSPESRQQVRDLLLKRENSENTTLHFETKGQRKNGDVFELEIESSICIIDGKEYSIAHHRDSTERKRIETELQKSQKLESLGILAGGIAHDFNNLMTGVFGYIDLAINKSKDDAITGNLTKAASTIDRARALTRQLLTFAKGGAPIQKIHHLFPFVQETASFALSGSTSACTFTVQNDLWPCNFDKNQIGQVIDNIIINAQQSMPLGGTIELTARNSMLSEKEHPFLQKGNYVKISIKDSGVGIPREFISKIFDPFFTTKTKGHGLGLATCYSIVNRHDGCIDVDSEPGKGSTFHLYLPAAADTVQSNTEQIPTEHKGSGTFLIMDDEKVIRETLHDTLESFGYDVVCKESGQEAIDFFLEETLANRKISGMIFDLTVPGGMGGKAAAAGIRKVNIEIPVFVASGYAEDPVMKNPTEYGFTASICKPFRTSELSEMLNTYFQALR